MSTEPFQAFVRLAQHAYSAGAQDLHLAPGQPPRGRVDGVLAPLPGPAFPSQDVSAIALQIFGRDVNQRLERLGMVQRPLILPLLSDGRCTVRVTLTRCAGQFSLSFRYLVESDVTLTAADLGVPEVLLPLLDSDTGLLVVAGPHASGKTTTLFALLEQVNRERDALLCTVEDPLDRVMEPVRALVQQREVGVDVADVATGIAAAVAQDADVIGVSALSSLEGLTAALHAAETGHLVLTQVHAESAQEALLRIVEATPESLHGLVRRALSQSLLGVCFQRLLPRAPRGRVAAYQVLLPDEALRRAILEGQPLGAGAPGSVELAHQVAALVERGQVRPEDAAAIRSR
ncbi:MAG: ATPase, T2SS/T4P/T4SS family [Planctomycetota bacterium]